MDVQEHLALPRGSIDYEPLPRIECADGFSLSVQASRYHYCEPRTSSGPWLAVEVGMPSEIESALLRWAEDASDPTGTVYGYVPVRLVQAIVDAHDAAGRLNAGDPPVTVMADALRELGRIRTDGPPATWTKREMFALGRCVALMDALYRESAHP